MTCYRCGGSGYSSESVTNPCSSCGGSGRAYGYGDICNSCGGSGATSSNVMQVCSACGGTGGLDSTNTSGLKTNNRVNAGSPRKPAGYELFIDNLYSKIPGFVFVLLGIIFSILAIGIAHNSGWSGSELIFPAIIGFAIGYMVLAAIAGIIKLTISLTIFAVVMAVIIAVIYFGYKILIEQ